MGHMKELAIGLEEVELLVLQGRTLDEAIKIVAQPPEYISWAERPGFQAKKEKNLLWAWNSRYPAKEIE